MSDKQKEILKRLFDKQSVLDLLLQVEKFLDESNLYVYPNWFKGELISGPHPRRYWISVSLKYDYKDMPDPKGAMILSKLGVKVSYKKTNEIVGKDVKKPEDLDSTTGKPKKVKKPIWIIDLKIPRRFIDEADLEELEIFDDELDIEDISDANDIGDDII